MSRASLALIHSHSNSTMRAHLVFFSAVALLLLVVAEAKKAPRQDEAESWSHGSKKYSKDHQKPQHFEHRKQEEEVNDAVPKQAPLEVPEPEIELQGHLEKKGHKVPSAEEDLHLQDLAYEEKSRHRKQEGDKKKSKADEKKLFAEQEEEAGLDEKVIEDSFEPLEQQQQQEKPKKSNKKQKEEKKRQKEEKKQKHGSKKAHEKKSKDKQKKKYNKKEHNKKEHNKKKH